MATLESPGLRKSFGATAGAARHRPVAGRRRDAGDRRRLGLRQVDAAAAGRGAGDADRRAHPARRPRRHRLDPSERDIAMVFQNYALYPHMTVFDNMAYGLRIRGLSRDEITPPGRRGGRAARARRAAGSASRGSYPAASASAWRWAARSCANRSCSCSTSRCPTWTPSCACRCAPKSAGCSGAWASPACTSRTTRWRR